MANIEDENFRTIGYTSTSNGKTHIFKVGGYCLGWYDHSEDKTYKTGGAYVGKGNLLGILLTSGK